MTTKNRESKYTTVRMHHLEEQKAALIGLLDLRVATLRRDFDHTVSEVRREHDALIASFKKGTHDFGLTVDVRFAHVLARLGQEFQGRYDLSRRIEALEHPWRARWRRVRNWFSAFRVDLREAYDDWKWNRAHR